MNSQRVEDIANAVLYEGYILYPYRASAIKNRKRFNFGVIYPREGGGTQLGTSPQFMQTECLVRGEPGAEIEVKVRFLHVVARTAGELAAPLAALKPGVTPEFRPVEAIEVQGKVYWSWQEATEREVMLPACLLDEAARRACRYDFSFPAEQKIEPLTDEGGHVAAILLRKQEQLDGSVELSAELVAGSDSAGGPSHAGERVYRLRVRIANRTARANEADDPLARSLVSTHTLLHLRGEGEFISSLDPPDRLKAAASLCQNEGAFPVLAGDEAQRDTMFSSPIILYDFPQVAAESAGEFFDGTEIDEMLALRIMTLTDDEKREMGEVDEKARQLLERTEALPPEHLMKLHGVLRGLRSAAEERP